EAEKRILDVGTTLPPDSSIVVWDVDLFADGDSTHAVVISDRSRAPNLAAVREMAMGIENVGGVAAPGGEIWIDDLRLGAAADQGGAAMRAGVNVTLADVARLETSISHQNPFYRQLGTDPSYQSSSSLTSRAHVEAGRFLPRSLGLAMPFDLQYLSDRSDPFFTREADVLAERIPNLRTPHNSAMSWNVGLFKRAPSGNAILRSTVDGLRLSYSRSSTNQTATQSETDGAAWSAAATWSRSVTDLSLPLLPGFLRAAIDGLPGFLSNSTIFENLRDLRFRYTPRDLNFGANLSNSNVERRRFTSSISGSEPAIEPTIDRQRTLAPRAGVVLQPFPSLVAGYSVANVRDLVDPSFRLTTPAGVQALEDERRSFLGAAVGWELARTTNTNLTYQPELSSWFDPRFTLATTYQSNRNASYVVPTDTGGDTTLVRDLRLARNMALDVDVQPVNLLTVLGVPPARSADGFARTVRSVWDRLRPIRLAWTRNVDASYDRRDLESSFKDQLVLDSFDRLRFLTPTDTASSATKGKRFSVGGGLRLPANLDAEIDYSVRTSSAFTPRSVRTTDETEWPSVRLRWRSVPVPSFLDAQVRSMALTAGVRILDRVTTTGTGQDQGSESLTRSLALTFVFVNGFNMSYELSNTRNERTDGTGFSRSDRNSHSIRGTGTVPAPGFIGFVKNPVRLSAEFTLNGNADCRELGGSGFGPSAGLAGGDGCVAHVDQTTNNLSLTADTDFSGYGIGVQLLWVHRASAVGTRQSSDQYNLNIFGRFYLRSETAELPPP
ncbi:MAG: hypothetical protein ACR2GQ_03240, partial [Gemmatimonadota bacterium]